MLAILCAVPAAVGSHVKEVKGDSVEFNVCYPFPEKWLDGEYGRVNVLMKFLILYIIPLQIIGIFYCKMANHLFVSLRNVPGEAQGTQRQVSFGIYFKKYVSYNISPCYIDNKFNLLINVCSL